MKVDKAKGVVTGGAGGLGEGAVRMLIEGGGSAAILDLPASRGADLAAELGERATFIPTNVSDPDNVQRSVAQAAQALGRIDLCVNCAGISPAHRVVAKDRLLHPIDLFRRTVEINLVGLFDVTRWTAYYMAENQPSEEGERGLIVNVASIAGFEGQIGQAGYAASKGGVIALTLQLARDLAQQGIRVMAIAPGMMDTQMIASLDDQQQQTLIDTHVFPKRLGFPSEFAALIRTFMTTTLLNGEVVRLDAAARLPPR